MFILYYLPILFGVIALSITLINNRKLDLYFLLIIFIFVFLVTGTKFNSDVDYFEYYELYLETPSLDIISLENIKSLYGEIGYLYFTSFLKLFESDFVVVTLVFSSLSMLFKIVVSFNIVNKSSFLIILYLYLYFITVEFIEMRWSLASGMIILSYYLLIIDKKKYAYFFLFLAATIHYFAILFLILSIFLAINFVKKNDNLYLFISVVIACMFFSIFIGKNTMVIELDEINIYIVQRILRYFNDPQSGLGIFSYLKICLYILIFLLFVNKYNYRQVYYVKISCIFLSISLFLSVVPIFYYRSMVVSDFFALATIIHIIDNNLNKKLRVFSILIIFFLFSTWFIFDVNNYIISERILDYKSLLY